MRWLGQRAGGYRFLHGRAARVFNKRFNIIGIGSICLNAITVGLNIPNLTNCATGYEPMRIIAICISIIVTIVMAFQQFKDYGARRSNHVTSEANYSGLYDTIKNELEKRQSARQDADDFVEWITKQFADLKSSSPLIPDFLMKEYRKMIEGQHIADPEGIDEILVNHEDDSTSSSSSPKTSMVATTTTTEAAPDIRINIQEEPSHGILRPMTSLPTPADQIAFERWNEQ